MNKINRRFFWLCVLLVMTAALLLSIRIPFLYMVNDDLFMKNIVSGAYLGRPDAHTVYMEYPLSLFLSGLYRMAAGVPWYGIVFFLFHVVSWGSIFYRGICSRGRGSNCRSVSCCGKRQPAAVLFFLLLFLAVGFYHIAGMQFTVTAAVLGTAALVWFLTADLSLPPVAFLRDQSVTALLVFLSFNVRRNVLLMFVPVAGMLWLGRLFEGRRQEPKQWRERIPKFAGMAALCAMGMALSFISYRAAYGSQDWQNYIRYNDNATVLYDYSGWPDYDTNRALYEELGITYESWYGAKTAYLLAVDNGIDAAAMERLAERSAEQKTALPQSLAEALRVCVQKLYAEEDRPLNILVTGLYAAVLGGLLAGGNKSALLQLLFFAAGRLFSWLYVVLEGRYPVRITQSLLLMECAVLLVFLMRDALRGYEQLWCKSKEKTAGNTLLYKICRPVLAGAGVCFFVLTGYFGIARIRHVYYENTRRLEESRDLEEVKTYCSAHRERFYFIDSKSVSNDTERIFDGAQSAYENYIVFGGWLSASPVYLNKLAAAGARDVEKALLESGRVFVIAENEDRCSLDYIVAYFESRYDGFVMEETERFGREGGQFLVYRLAADTTGGRTE